MFLIASAAYATPELIAEFGQIPPSFLPIKNQRLYELQAHQIALSMPQEKIFLSIPEDFPLKEFDKIKIDALALNILRVPSELSIGESISHAINMAKPCDNEPVRILYGDTYIEDMDFSALDAFSIGRPSDEYNWHYTGRDEVVCGYFAFSSRTLFENALQNANFDFMGAISGLAKMQNKKWCDFGHINTFYRSKAIVSRHFNSIKNDGFIVTKESRDKTKCNAEAAWFKNAPPSIRPYIPNFISKSDGSYQTEYLCLSPLSDLLVFSELHESTWKRIFDAIFVFVAKMAEIKSPAPFDQKKMYLDKTVARLIEFHSQTGIAIDRPICINGTQAPSLMDVAHESYQKISANHIKSFIHGDLCFSNILYDFCRNMVKVVDPRGLDENGAPSMYGDLRYDIAKLAHSAIGRYDFIMANMAKTYIKSDGTINIDFIHTQNPFLTDIFMRHSDKIADRNDIHNIMIQLFLSMLPLHCDCRDRQVALLANALLLYTDGSGA